MSKTKRVTVAFIDPDSEPGLAMYADMARLIEQAHEELAPARIALAWNMSWKLDVDGRLTLGKCRKATDLDREFIAYDFVILLNREFYESGDVSDAQRHALLDHELSHAMPKLDDDGEQVEDERDRKVWRMRKHDIEEFSGVVQRHGLYKADLEDFARALARGAKAAGQVDLFADAPRVTLRAVAAPERVERVG